MFLSRKKNTDDNSPPSEEEVLSQSLNKSLSRVLQNPLKQGPVEDGTVRAEIIHALGVLETAFFTIDRVKELTLEACHIALKASSNDDLGNRALLAERYDEVRQSIDTAIEETEGPAKALLGEEKSDLILALSGRSNYTIPAARLDCGKGGLNLTPPITGFSETEEISAILRNLDKALEKIDRASHMLMKDAQYLTTKISSLDE